MKACNYSLVWGLRFTSNPSKVLLWAPNGERVTLQLFMKHIRNLYIEIVLYTQKRNHTCEYMHVRSRFALNKSQCNIAHTWPFKGSPLNYACPAHLPIYSRIALNHVYLSHSPTFLSWIVSSYAFRTFLPSCISTIVSSRAFSLLPSFIRRIVSSCAFSRLWQDSPV